MLTLGKDGVMADKDGIIAAGPLFKQRNTLAHRVVIRELGRCGPWEDMAVEYAVIYQGFPNWPSLKSPCFYDGIYTRDLGEAMIAFSDRIRKGAEYRPEQITKDQTNGRAREDPALENPHPVQRP